MKKITVFFVFVFLCSITQINAQSIGARVGGGLSKYVCDNSTYAEDMKQKPGIMMGIMLGMPIVPLLLDVQPELMLYQKGVNLKNTTLDIKGYTDIFYVDMPINFRLTLPLLPVYAIAGPYFGYAISGTNHYETAGVTLIDKATIDFDKNGTRAFDYGINAGIGYMKDITLLHFFAELRYNMGLYDIDGSKNLLDGSQIVSLKNSNISLSVGVLLGKK